MLKQYEMNTMKYILSIKIWKDYSTLISTPCLSGVNWWQCAIPNIQPYMSRLMLEFVSSTKIYRVVQYKTLIVRFLCLFSLSDKSERSIELITRYMDDKSPRKNVVFEGFWCFIDRFIFERNRLFGVSQRIVDWRVWRVSRYVCRPRFGGQLSIGEVFLLRPVSWPQLSLCFQLIGGSLLPESRRICGGLF